MPAGHGGAEGKRCAYFVDERYLASLGLMALKISSRIPMQPSPAKPWELALVFPMQLRGSTIQGLPRGILKNHRVEKNNFGPPVKSDRYFLNCLDVCRIELYLRNRCKKDAPMISR